ncbi:hypothetical protein F6X40_19935 [Paraburkholderia sp. UCT31]|uniref:hypothetical protein n=1 Tax=Paraburkholderia sp. UCT31 TaxID=2615209 RepID=UPI00165639C2|nr:hypothetical protein [Paraburkholderia sp. UCT31]MBC8739027.1 hypothetical protein [Paraburkholderia sp. UCT31]
MTDEFNQVATLVKVGLPIEGAAAIVRASADAFRLQREGKAGQFDAIGNAKAIASGGLTDAQAVAVIEVLRGAIAPR